MKSFLLLILITTQVQAKKLIIAHFDPFDGAKLNNSETVAKEVMGRLQNKGIEILLCPLSTSFQLAYPQLKKCLESFKTDLVIGLGESGCKLKAEFTARNNDKTFGPDNLGEERNHTQIIKDGAPYLSIRYPLPQMYCALNAQERRQITISNNAGSFVCNNVAYQMRYFHPEMMIGFIHVPSHTCKNLKHTNREYSLLIQKMILAGLNTPDNGPYLPHETNFEEIPLTKNEIKQARMSVSEKCYQDFYKNLKAIDARAIWPF